MRVAWLPVLGAPAVTGDAPAWELRGRIKVRESDPRDQARDDVDVRIARDALPGPTLASLAASVVDLGVLWSVEIRQTTAQVRPSTPPVQGGEGWGHDSAWPTPVERLVRRALGIDDDDLWWGVRP